MTVSTTINRVAYAGDGVTTSFGTSPVVFFTAADIQVYVTVNATGVQTLLVNGTQYLVTGGNDAVGTVRLDLGASPYGAVASGSTLTILRSVALTQGTNLINGDASDAEVQEQAFDRLTFIAQQLQEIVNRVIRLPTGDVSGSVSELLSASARAGLLLGFDASGLLTYYTPQSATPNSIGTFTVKVVTPQVTSAGQLNLAANNTVAWVILGGGNAALAPGADNILKLGDPTLRIATAFATAIDSGTTGSLSLKTNNGTVGLQVVDVASGVNFLQAVSGTTGNAPGIQAGGANTDIGINYIGKGNSSHVFYSDSGSNAQFAILRTTSAVRNLTITGAAAGGNPILDASAGAIRLSAGTADIQWGKANVAVGGGASPTFGTIGATGPAAAAQRNWLRFIESDGTASFIPVWR